MPSDLRRPDPEEGGLNPNTLAPVTSSSPPRVAVCPTEAGVMMAGNDNVDSTYTDVGQDRPHQDEEQPRLDHHHHAAVPGASSTTSSTTTDGADAAGWGAAEGGAQSMEIVDTGACPSPFASMDILDDRAKKLAVFEADVVRIIAENDVASSSTNPPPVDNAAIDGRSPDSRPSSPSPLRDNTVGNGDVVPESSNDTRIIVEHQEDEEVPRRTHCIHDAFLVDDDGEVIVATPIEQDLPWWKVKRIQLFLCGLLLLAVANATTIGLLLSSGNKENKEPPMTTTATANASNLFLKSHPPSMSPEACADKVSANAHKVEILRLDDPWMPTISVDGRDMVMAVGDATTSQQVVIFYSLPKNETVWQQVKSFRIDNVGNGKASVALSGKTAVVGFGEANNFAGEVMVFERNQFGDWEKMNPFIRTATTNTTDDMDYRYGFGLHHIDIDGDFACVVDYNDCVHFSGANGCNHNVNVFHRTMGTWVEFDVISGQNCKIAGDKLVVLDFETFSDSSWILQLYSLNETLVGVVPSQDPIVVYAEVLSMELSQSSFVFWDRFQQGATIYQRRNESVPYSFVEQITINAPSENQIALDNDVLIVGGYDETYVFSYRNGNWVESFTLEQRYGHFKYYQLSGRTLVASTSEMNIYSFNIEECTKEIPTQSQFLVSMETPMSPLTTVRPPTMLSSSPSQSSSISASSSFSPSACVAKTMSNSQRIETFDDTTYLTVALDGATMLLVVKDGNGQGMVIFHNWKNNGEWQQGEDFNLGDLSSINEAFAALSDNDAFVGFLLDNDRDGGVFVFHRNRAGIWEKEDDPFLPNLLELAPQHRALGYAIDVNGDLAIVAFIAIDSQWDVNKLALYQRESTKWVLVDILNGRCPCSITGYVFVSVKTDESYNEVVQLYKYNADDRSIVPLQQSIPSGQVQQVDSSNDYIVYWDSAASWKDGPSSSEKQTSDTLMFRRDEGNQTFTFLRRFDIVGTNGALSMNNDILILSGKVFMLQHGEWIEAFTLSRRFDEYKLSGRLVLARTNNEVVSFSIDDCAQEMPTQVPTLSLSPSHIPSIPSPTAQPSSSVVPSLSPPPTDHPSTSLTPTFTSFPSVNCDWIVIYIEYDSFSSEVSWKLFSIDESVGSSLVRSHATNEKIPSYLESMCLPDGTYKFVIYDSAHDGICCTYDQNSFYSLSLDNGVLIRSGGEFEWSESTMFSIPFTSLS
jgi:hypothetical protein